MELYHYPMHELNKLLTQKELSVPELTKLTLDRIESTQDALNSFVAVDEKGALLRAKEIEAGLSETGSIPVLAGMPAAIKDNICTKDFPTTCASKILQNFLPPYNATVIEKLGEQQVIPIGKTNMDEFGMGSSSEKSVFGPTKNPWNISRVAGGSSGGSASAVASGQAAFALGSDTGGSIRQPASYCGVVGIKPTYGAVSRFGLVAYASSLDQIGAFTKDVRDCAHVLNAITGHDEKDSTSYKGPYPDYTAALQNDVRGLKLALPKEYFGAGLNPEVGEKVRAAAKKLEELGARCEEVSLPVTEYAIPAYYIIACAEASSNLARFDGVKYGYRAENVENLQELYCRTRSEGFGKEVQRRIMLGTFVLSSGYYDAYYRKAQQVRTLIRKGFHDVLSRFDAILCPVTPDTAFGLGEKSTDPLEMYLEDIYTVSLNIAGLPGMSVPCGFDAKGLPIGLQLIGREFGEDTLLRIAYTYEQNTEHGRKRPKI